LTELSNWDLISSTEEVLSALPETVVAVDDDLRLRAANRVPSPLFVKSPVLGDRLGDVLESSAVGQVSSLIVKAQREGSAEGEYRTELGLYRVTARRMGAYTLLVFQDTTTLRHAEEAVADLVRDRSRFLASVSHELRTPLSAVLGYANLLAEPDPNLDEPMRIAMVQDMTDQAWDLAGIVEDLLAVARTEIGELRVVTFPVNLAANVAQVIESMGGRGAHIEVIARQAVTGVGDPARFRQVVRNLLSNAATHGAEPITVEITANDTHGILEVKDRGLGVPDALTETIFNQYVFAHNGGGSGRAGVGLWISRELTNLMSGNLSYRREGGATVFRATIPLLHEPERRR
jgi:signal transduction histidine kinase